MLGEILLLSFNGYNRSVLKKNDFNFNWIFPRTGHSQKYWMITATNGLLIIILPLYFTHVLNGNVELILKSLITTFCFRPCFYTLVSCEKNKLKFEFKERKDFCSGRLCSSCFYVVSFSDSTLHFTGVVEDSWAGRNNTWNLHSEFFSAEKRNHTEETVCFQMQEVQEGAIRRSYFPEFSWHAECRLCILLQWIQSDFEKWRKENYLFLRNR